MTDIELKVVPMRPKHKVPAEAKPVTVEGLLAQLADRVGILEATLDQRLAFTEKLVFDIRKELSDLRLGVNFNDARLNENVRLAKTLAAKAGIAV